MTPAYVNRLINVMGGLLIVVLLGFVLSNQPVLITAQSTVTDTVYDAISHESLTVSSVALPISPGVLTVSGVPADRCYITTETQPLRWTTDGTVPTTLTGHLAPVGTQLTIVGRADLAAFRAIRTGTDATAKVTCSRRASP
jgi:hypothetical protein